MSQTSTICKGLEDTEHNIHGIEGSHATALEYCGIGRKHEDRCERTVT